MAIYKIGTLVSDISGTVGGSTFSRNGSGLYVKNWSRGPVVRNDSTAEYRALPSLLGGYWSVLPVSWRDLWALRATQVVEIFYNRFGDVIQLSGWQLFCTINMRRASASGYLLLSAPD